MPDHTFSLSPKDRDTILNTCEYLDLSIRRKLSLGVQKKKRLEFSLSEQELILMANEIVAAFEDCSRSERRVLEKIVKKLPVETESIFSNQYSEQEWDEDKRLLDKFDDYLNEFDGMIKDKSSADPMSDFANDVFDEEMDDEELVDMFNAIVLSKVEEKYGSIDDMDDDRLEELVNLTADEIIATPIEEWGNLSFMEVNKLISSDYSSSTSAVHLSENLSIKDIKDVEFFHNCMTFLKVLNEGNSVPMTKDGFIQPGAIDALIEDMINPAGIIQSRKNGEKTFRDEQHLFHLVRVRAVLTILEYVHEENRILSITELGKKQLNGNNPGRLFADMCRTYLFELDFDFIRIIDEFPEFQQSFPYTLYRFADVGKDWLLIEDCPYFLFSPIVNAKFDANAHYNKFHKHLYTHTHIITPLYELGLLEIEYEEPLSPDAEPDGKAIRKSPLFDKLFRFDLTIDEDEDIPF